MPKDRVIAMSYRPEGWRKLNPCECVSVKAPFVDIFEAGADAMLEGLKEEGIFTYGAGHYPDIEVPKEVSGYWCFIPDEAEEYEQATTVEFTPDDVIGE